MANEKSDRAKELKEARRKKPPVRRYDEPSVGTGKYSDRIRLEPYTQMRPKPEPFIPKDPMRKT